MGGPGYVTVVLYVPTYVSILHPYTALRNGTSGAFCAGFLRGRKILDVKKLIVSDGFLKIFFDAGSFLAGRRRDDVAAGDDDDGLRRASTTILVRRGRGFRDGVR